MSQSNQSYSASGSTPVRPRRKSLFGNRSKQEKPNHSVVPLPTHSIVSDASHSTSPSQPDTNEPAERPTRSREPSNSSEGSNRSLHRRSGSQLIRVASQGTSKLFSSSSGKAREHDQSTLKGRPLGATGSVETPRQPQIQPPPDVQEENLASPLRRNRSATVGSSTLTPSSSASFQAQQSQSDSPGRPRSNTWRRLRPPSSSESHLYGETNGAVTDENTDSQEKTKGWKGARKSMLAAFKDPSPTGLATTNSTPIRRRISPSFASGKGARKSIAQAETQSSNKETNGESSGSLLKRMGSRSLLRGSRESLRETRDPINASQESLASTSALSYSSLTQTNLRGRDSSTIDRMIPSWMQNRNKSDHGDEALKNLKGDGAKELPRDSSGQESDVAQSFLSPEGQETLDQGLPKRLSGWLLNMLGNDASPTSSPSPNDAKITTPRRTSNSSLHPTGPTGSATKARQSAGFLSSFSTSARARAAAAAGAAVTSTGLERALKFMSEGDESGEIWVLGVCHSPSPDEAVVAKAPTIQIHAASPHPSLPASPDKLARHPHAVQNKTTVSPCNPADISDPMTRKSRGSHTADSEDRSGPKSPISRSSASLRSSDDTSSLRTTESRTSITAPSPSTHSSGDQKSFEDDWHANFAADFASKVWCTYRSHFVPIARDGTITEASEAFAAATAAEKAAVRERTQLPSAPETPSQVAKSSSQHETSSTVSSPAIREIGRAPAGQSGSPTSPALGASLGVTAQNLAPGPSLGTTSLSEKMGLPNLWGRATAVVQATGFAGRSGLTTDAGWGCMLRTGQSLLANALVQAHLGRGWRRSPQPLNHSQAPINEAERQKWEAERARFAQYVEIISWFMDEPSRACPFGIHRMAREGKRLGKEVGEWFGPSTASGAIRQLVVDFPGAGIGASVATDGVVYLDEVRKASMVHVGKSDVDDAQKARHQKGSPPKLSRPVLILVGVRLGLEGVHPTYHEAIRLLFTFPQCVGIAGGRPSSSYYFVGYQGHNLFYLDPHNVRPAVEFRHPPPSWPAQSTSREGGTSDDSQGVSRAEWWSHVYSDAELATFHCDKPRRMPIRSLDPSMLLGFLARNEEDLLDLKERIKKLPKPILSVQDEMPRWMRDDADDEEFDAGSERDDDPSLESFSESSQLGEAGERVDVTGDGDDLLDDDDQMTEHRHGLDASKSQVSGPSAELKHQRSSVAVSHGSNAARPLASPIAISQDTTTSVSTPVIHPDEHAVADFISRGEVQPLSDNVGKSPRRPRHLSATSDMTARNVSDPLVTTPMANLEENFENPTFPKSRNHSITRNGLRQRSPRDEDHWSKERATKHHASSVVPFPAGPLESSASPDDSWEIPDERGRRETPLLQSPDPSRRSAHGASAPSVDEASDSEVKPATLDWHDDVLHDHDTRPSGSSTVKANASPSLSLSQSGSDVRQYSERSQPSLRGFSTSWEEVSYASAASTSVSPPRVADQGHGLPSSSEADLSQISHRGSQQTSHSTQIESKHNVSSNTPSPKADLHGATSSSNEDEGWSLTFGPAED